MLKRQEKRYKRHKRIRAKIFGTAEVPRLCVFRSSKHIYAELIDDEKGRVIGSASDLGLKTGSKKLKKDSAKTAQKSSKTLSKKVGIAFEVGKLIAQKADEKKIVKVVFDRGGFYYHGRVRALAEGARSAGLKF